MRVMRFASIHLVLLGLLLLLGTTAPLHAQSPAPALHRAGLVVVYADGTVESRCVGFEEESISGFDLLARGDFAVRSDVTSMGASVCSVDGQGCGEGQDCFCQCKSSPCTYWTYWQQLPDGWRYANVGAATVQVHDGDVQGWVWGESTPNAAAQNAPPALTFADICSDNATIHGVAAQSDTANGAGAEPTFAQTGYAITQGGLVALVVALPLILGAAWWLWQRRKAVQP